MKLSKINVFNYKVIKERFLNSYKIRLCDGLNVIKDYKITSFNTSVL